MSNAKLLKVMDYLINEQEDKARELLHQIFIEKARSIHEEMSHEDMDEEVLDGDVGEHMGRKIGQHVDEINREQHYGDGTMEDTDLDSAIDDLSASEEEDMDDEDMDDEFGDEDEISMDDEEDDLGDEEHEEEEHEKIEDLEQAIEDLKAEFEALRSEVEGGAPAGEEAGEMGQEGEEGEVEEGWMTDDLDEDFSDLEEAVDLEEVPVNMKKPGEVGSGKYARTETNVASPTAKTRPDMGVKPVQIKSKGHTGYNLEGAPASKEIPGTANRRKKSTDGTSKVSKEGDTKAMLNKDRSDGYGAQNVASPIGSKGTTPTK